MTFMSFVVATYGRRSEVERLLASLEVAYGRGYEVIVVDQNPDERLVGPCTRRWRFPLQRLRCAPGVGRARNVGREAAVGDWSVFLDDDCRVPEDYPVAMRHALEQSVTGVVLGGWHDERGRRLARLDREPGSVDAANQWRRVSEANMAVHHSVGIGFDVRLGPGSGTPFTAHEGNDFVLAALAAGYPVLYRPDVCVLHDLPPDGGSVSARRTYSYGMGLGYVLTKHETPLRERLSALVRPLCGAMCATTRGETGRMLAYTASFRGRLRGMRAGGRLFRCGGHR